MRDLSPIVYAGAVTPGTIVQALGESKTFGIVLSNYHDNQAFHTIEVLWTKPPFWSTIQTHNIACKSVKLKTNWTVSEIE